MTAAGPQPAPSPPVVRLSGPADLVGAVPSLLGFHPSESLVLCCLRGPSRRHCVTMRVDLPAAGDAAEVIAGLAERARAVRADSALLVVYTEAGGGPVRRDLVTAAGDALTGLGIALEDAYRVGRGRWWSYLCQQESCCPAAGTPLPDQPGGGALQLQAEMIGCGMQVHADRDALRASIAPIGFPARAGLEQAYARCERERAARLLAGAAARLRQDTISLCRELRQRYRTGGGPVTDAEAARVCLGLQDVPARDAVLAWAAAPNAPVLALLTDLARKALPPVDAPLCAVLAHVAYQHGDGALAACALDRALESGPTYQLAVLLEFALSRAIHPSVLAPAFAPPSRKQRRRRR